MTRHYLSMFNDLDAVYNALTGCCSSNSCQKSSCEGLFISEDENNVYIDAQVPGVKPSDVEVTVDPKKRQLLIKGESKLDRENVKYHLRSGQKHSYEIPLSNEINLEETVEAAMSKEGILSITLSKNKSHKPLKVDVKMA